MNVKIVYSLKKNINEIVLDIKEQLQGFDYNLIQFYASSNFNSEELNKTLYKELGEIPMFGCTTAGELISGKMMENSVVLIAMNKNILPDFKIEVLENISDNKLAVDNAFEALKSHFGESLQTLDTKKHLGFVLIDGLSGQEEAINERIGDLTNITFVGGSAGDDLKFKKTFIFANGKTYTNAAVLCLTKCNAKFFVLKTQSFETTGKKLTATKVNEQTRTVIEFNNKQALEEYAILTNINKNEAYKKFPFNPLGLNFGDDNFFVRSPQRPEGNNIVFYCAVKQGMELELLKAKDIIEDTKKDLNNTIKEFGKVTALINYNCILRTLDIKAKNQTEAYGKIFENIPTIGFSTYGESYIGHINQTSVILIFGE